MEVKNEKVFPQFISQLTDWEILSAFIYCNKILKREDFILQEEFYDLCFFFFEGDEEETVKVLETVKELYMKEYSKRHAN